MVPEFVQNYIDNITPYIDDIQTSDYYNYIQYGGAAGECISCFCAS